MTGNRHIFYFGLICVLTLCSSGCRLSLVWVMTCIHLLQVVDYAIAKRIVDLHSRSDESVDRYYSVEDISRYLMFARQFKPKVCP